MKKTLALIMMAATVAISANAFSWGKKKPTETKAEPETKTEATKSETTLLESIDNAEKNISKGIDSVLGKTKEKTVEDISTSIKSSADEFGKKVGDSIKTGAQKAEDAINTHQIKALVGELRVKGSGANTVFTLNAEDGNAYTLKTISSSEDSIIKLSAYNKKKIKVSGMLNTTTSTITLATYKLAD